MRTNAEATDPPPAFPKTRSPGRRRRGAKASPASSRIWYGRATACVALCTSLLVAAPEPQTCRWCAYIWSRVRSEAVAATPEGEVATMGLVYCTSETGHRRAGPAPRGGGGDQPDKVERQPPEDSEEAQVRSAPTSDADATNHGRRSRRRGPPAGVVAPRRRGRLLPGPPVRELQHVLVCAWE